MTFIAVTNIILIFLCVFTMLLVWQRNRRLKQAYLARLLKEPKTFEWLAQNLTGNEIADIKAARIQFGLPILEAKQLVDTFRKRNGSKG